MRNEGKKKESRFQEVEFCKRDMLTWAKQGSIKAGMIYE